MSMAIALDNSPDTIANLSDLKKLLTALNDGPISVSAILSYQRLEDLRDWIDDIHKILTDFTIFGDGTLDV